MAHSPPFIIPTLTRVRPFSWGSYGMERQCGTACGQQGVPAFLSGSARVSCPAMESDIKLPDTQKIIYAAGDGPRWQRLVLGRKGQMHGNEMIYIIEEPLVNDEAAPKKVSSAGWNKSLMTPLYSRQDVLLYQKQDQARWQYDHRGRRHGHSQGLQMKNLPKRLWNRLRLSHHMAGSPISKRRGADWPRMSGIYDGNHAGITFCAAYQYGIGPLGYGSFHVGPACFFRTGQMGLFTVWMFTAFLPT